MQTPTAARPPRSNPDFATLAGVILGAGSIVGGLVLEGGAIRDIAQPSAALVVIGGTLGAVLFSSPIATLWSALRKMPTLFFERPVLLDAAARTIAELAVKVRKNGITTLEDDAEATPDRFLKKALNLLADGTSGEEIRQMMEIDINVEEMHGDAEAKVFESAGGFAPTVGIIGAVLGLIQVMKHLENIGEVGRGIAVSFVATIYGVALANLFLLPAANKLKARTAGLVQLHELILEGVVSIADGLNPTLLRIKLDAYAPDAVPSAGAASVFPNTAPAPV